MLEVKQLKKTWPGVKKNEPGFSISLDLFAEEGKTLVLVGPSGSGKTSALNLITGLTQADSGKVILNGKDITALPTHQRNISVVFQDLALFPHLDVGENIAYGLFIKGINKKERRRIAEEMLSLVRLPDFASRHIDTLSGGERQRVAIARALASNPDLLLLDEPFSSLDAPLRNSMRREFLELRIKSKAACIFITHDREEAMMLGDNIALIDNGRIIEAGTGPELFLKPKTEFAARFFGAGQVFDSKTIPGMTESPEPLVFIPHDAIKLGSANEPDHIALTARFTGSFFGGHNQVLVFQLGGEIPFEVIVSPRTQIPAVGSLVNLQIDKKLLKFVEPAVN